MGVSMTGQKLFKIWGGSFLAAAFVLMAGLGLSSVAKADEANSMKLHPPENKQTSLGLYVTAHEAYEIWKADPERVKIIDVRTPEEYAFVGHPDHAWNIPLAFVTYQRENGVTKYGPKWNPDFVDEVKKIAGPTDKLLVMCRSGDRSAMAVNQLAAAGLKNVYTVTDGFEGDKVDDPGSVFHGKRMRNGWKNSVPWVYTIDPEKIILKEGASKQTQ